MTTQGTLSKLEEVEISPPYEMDAQGRLVNYCLSIVASDVAAADWKEGTGDKATVRSSATDLPPLNSLPTSMSASTSALASIHQEISNYLSRMPNTPVKYGDIQVHLGWKITKAADLGASMGEIKKFVKWKVDAHNKQVAKDSGFNAGDFSHSEGESSDQGRRGFEGAAISRRKKNVSENISIGIGESFALGRENQKWAYLVLGLAVVTVFYGGVIVDAAGSAVESVNDFIGGVIGVFGAIARASIAGPRALISTLTQVTSFILRMDGPTLIQFATGLLFPMTSIAPIAHPIYYLLLSAYALLFTWHLRTEDLMLYEHLGDSPLFSQVFTPSFVAFVCYHLLTSSLNPILGVDAMLLQSNELLRTFGEDGLRARLGLMAGQSPCGVPELCPQFYVGTGKWAGLGSSQGSEVNTAIALVMRLLVAGVLIWGALDRWRARREIPGARV